MNDDNFTPEKEESNLPEESFEPDFSAKAPDFSAKDPDALAKPAKVYGTGTAVAAFIFFAITAVVFVIYEYLAFTFLYSPFVNGVHDFGEAITAVFGYTFGLIITVAFGIAQLPENIIAIVLFKRVRSCASGRKRVLYTVFFALSIVMLLLMLLTIGAFFLMIGSNS